MHEHEPKEGSPDAGSRGSAKAQAGVLAGFSVGNLAFASIVLEHDVRPAGQPLRKA